MTTLFIMTGCAIGLWLLSLKLNDASIADLIWGIWFVIEAGVAHLDTPTERSSTHAHPHNSLGGCDCRCT